MLKVSGSSGRLAVGAGGAADPLAGGAAGAAALAAGGLAPLAAGCEDAVGAGAPQLASSASARTRLAPVGDILAVIIQPSPPRAVGRPGCRVVWRGAWPGATG